MPQILALHGSGCTEQAFREQVGAIDNFDALTLPGHPGGEALESIEECAAWFARYAAWKAPRKSKKHANVIAAGNSLGGAIALEWALEFPSQAAGLVLVGTGARLRVAPNIFAMIDESWPDCIPSLVDLALAPAASQRLRDEAINWHHVVGQETTRRDYAACDRFDVMSRVGELKLPTLIIVGEQDRMTPAKYSNFLHEKIPGSRLCIVKDAGHLAMLEKPNEVNAAIEEFLTDNF